MHATPRVIITLFAACLALAQPQDTRPAYEVASIKPNNSGDGDTGIDGSTGQVAFTNMPLKRLIERAYNAKPPQIAGPGWLDAVRFDIVAKYPPGTKTSEHALMLRTLLEDRFKLAVHRESKEMPGYVLVVAKSGFKLKPVGATGHDTQHGGGRVQTLSAKGTSIAILADLLSRYLGSVVIDNTGISGAYDFELRWTNDDQPPETVAPETVPSLFTALQETLGLRLQPQKVPGEIIVVDHVERSPVEN